MLIFVYPGLFRKHNKKAQNPLFTRISAYLMPSVYLLKMGHSLDSQA